MNSIRPRGFVVEWAAKRDFDALCQVGFMLMALAAAKGTR
jgi:hypothetical protein